MASVAVGVAGPDEMHCGTPRCPTSTDGYMGKMDRAETPPGQLDLTCQVSPLNIETIVGPTRARRPQRVTPPSPRWTMGWSPHRHTLQLDYPIKYTTTYQPLTLLTAATCPPPRSTFCAPSSVRLRPLSFCPLWDNGALLRGAPDIQLQRGSQRTERRGWWG